MAKRLGPNNWNRAAIRHWHCFIYPAWLRSSLPSYQRACVAGGPALQIRQPAEQDLRELPHRYLSGGTSPKYRSRTTTCASGRARSPSPSPGCVVVGPDSVIRVCSNLYKQLQNCAAQLDRGGRTTVHRPLYRQKFARGARTTQIVEVAVESVIGNHVTPLPVIHHCGKRQQPSQSSRDHRAAAHQNFPRKQASKQAINQSRTHKLLSCKLNCGGGKGKARDGPSSREPTDPSAETAGSALPRLQKI